MSMFAEVRRALARLRYPSVDANGNLLTNGIVPRTGTLAELLVETGTGEGEIAVATDVDALVRYIGGSPSIYGGLRSVSVEVFFGFQNVTSGDQQIISSIRDRLGLVDDANDTFNLHAAMVPQIPIGRVTFRIRGQYRTFSFMTDANAAFTIELKRFDMSESIYKSITAVDDTTVSWTGTTDGSGAYNAPMEEKWFDLAHADLIDTRDFAFFITHDATQFSTNNANILIDIDY